MCVKLYDKNDYLKLCIDVEVKVTENIEAIKETIK